MEVFWTQSNGAHLVLNINKKNLYFVFRVRMEPQAASSLNEVAIYGNRLQLSNSKTIKIQ